MIRRNPIMKGARHCRAPIRIAELNLQSRKHYASIFTSVTISETYEHPVVDPHEVHERQVPERFIVNDPQEPQASPL